MKTKSPFALFFVFLLSSFAFAQSVVITPRKTVYERPKPKMDFKKSFTVTRPQVKAATPALSKKIEREISYEKNTNFNLREELTDYQWLEEADYEVKYNKNGLLDTVLFSHGSAAYPSSIVKEIVVDLKTGKRVRPIDVFINLPGLAASVRKMQQAEMRRARAEYKKELELTDFDGGEYFARAKFTAPELAEFSISDQGITFLYDYGFPRILLPAQPDGRYFFAWAKLKPFIKRGGLLARFIH